MSTAARPMTAEEYVRITPSDVPTELVRGEIVEMNRPGFRHARTCHRASLLIGNFVDAHDLGHVLTNDSGVITERNPDTVRGPDVWFVGYDKLPQYAEEPDGDLEIVPDLVFEVLSPFNRRADVLVKVGEYLDAGVPVVCVLDPSNKTAHLYYPEAPDVILTAEDELAFPRILPGFSVSVGQFFQR